MQGGSRTRLCSSRARHISTGVERLAWLGRVCTVSISKIPSHQKRTDTFTRGRYTHRDLRTRYQDGIGESRACAKERDGARLMQAWENGVRARHPEDGKVVSAPGGNVLDHCGIAHVHRYHKSRKNLFPLPQSLSIRSRAANKSCSENRMPSFSTASSETVWPQRSKVGRR